MIDPLQEIVCRYTADKKIILKVDMVLLADLGLNSLDLVEMVCEVEEKFGVEIPDRAISTLKTVQDLLNYISSHK